MSGQAGLRKINNNYVASGDGRDLLIYHDQSFRGGKAGTALTHPHLPNPTSGVPKVRRPVGSTLGFNARTEPHTQHLNLSQSSLKDVEGKKTRVLEGLGATGASLVTGSNFPRSRSQPSSNLEEPMKPFTYRWEESTRPRVGTSDWNPTAYALPDYGGVPARDLDLTSSMRAPEETAWNKRFPLRAYPGYSRTGLGGFWSQ
mmetsp:Transcript_14289/g.39546  ORF Transcript_14289/g.39546 Transcript_14289/m.39546 type:complete len:201 (-) Transcript_14289:106-708(-)